MTPILPTLCTLVVFQFDFPAFNVSNYGDCVWGSECCQNVGDLQLNTAPEKNPAKTQISQLNSTGVAHCAFFLNQVHCVNSFCTSLYA